MALRPACLTAAIAASLLLAPSAYAVDEAPTPVAASAVTSGASPDPATDATPVTDIAEAAPAAAAVAGPAVGDVTVAVAPALDLSSLQRVKVTSGLGVGPNGNRVGDHVLRLVMRGDTAAVTAAKVGLSALAFVTGVGDIGTSNSFSKNNVRGEDIQSVPSPAFGALPGMIREQLALYFAAHPGAIPSDERTVEASAGQWSLVYQKLSDAETPYELRHDVTIGFPLVRKLFRSASGGQGVHCQDEARVAPLQEWQADDYAKAKAASREFAEACIVRFVAELPRLFPDHGALPETAAEPELPMDTPAVTEEAAAAAQA
ncbi:hypothetical protein [Stenotrophomonas indicatrix]|uniref:hypothetical protein n=1 Tax=Stenotrophomonas indicatrix TaxID=2045451 RepID=UPI001071105E|nr:hypothetical protein [Stenotrophomonas indicatrix]QBR44447.1 hypothetical protein DAIF1_20120 [Stenotrophomonas indicatrix]QGL63542.1 hypothetical protein FEO87_09970 [Stenotrophomonas maltophilia]